MLSILTNAASLDAQQNLANTQNSITSSVNKLSSGMRITSAADDSAGLGISTNLEAQIASYNQAASNAQDGINLVSTASGSLNEVSNILSTLRSLAMQSASDGVGNTERGYIQDEAAQLSSELDQISNTAEYNGTQFFSSSATTLQFQVGIRNTTYDSISVSTATMGISSASLLGSSFSLSSLTSSQAALSTIDASIDSVSGYQATLGAAVNRFQAVLNSVQTASTNLSAADSSIRDVNVASESAKLASSQILAQAGISVLAQANQMPQMALKLLG
ncbi:MAG TPA: flagellin [Anaeromyxobacteraceae bacterium]|nr:flagellin [Anaeromyxobacteraceae bacterium]